MKRTLAVVGIGLVWITAGCTAPIRSGAPTAPEPATVAVQMDAGAVKEVETDTAVILEAMQMAQAGEGEAAIAGPLADIIEKYRSRYPSDSVKVYCAAGNAEAEAYAAMARDQWLEGVSLPVAIIDPPWAQAHFASAYAYSELGRFDQAQAELANALELSPMSSQYTNELAFHRIREGNWDEALRLYRSGEAYADLGDVGVAELKCTALRGQGYALVELHRLAEAIESYEACLALIPDEPKSLGELSYIRDLQN